MDALEHTFEESDLPYKGGNINWVASSDLVESGSLFLKNTAKKITKEGLVNCPSKLHPKNSIFMTFRAGIGHLAISTVPCAASQEFITIEAKNIQRFFTCTVILNS